MRGRAGVALLAENALRPLGNPSNWSQPAWRSTTLTSEKGAHVSQYGVAHVEYHLKWLESKYADGKTPGKPFGVGQTPQHLGNGFAAEIHRAIGHEEMDRIVGIPDIEVRMEPSSASGASPIGCTMRLFSPDLLCDDFCTQCPMRRQTAHSSLNSRIGLVCICWQSAHFTTRMAALPLLEHSILSGVGPRLVPFLSHSET
jgi:hypothetical protein